MKVFLKVGGKEIKPPFDSKDSSPRSLKVRAGDIVEATIHLDEDENALTNDGDVSFILQIGGEPDVRAFAEIESGKTRGKFLYSEKVDGKRKEFDKFQLFRGTPGGTGLFVLKRYDSSAPVWTLASIEVCDEVKGRLYDGMVVDILRMGLPHYVIDEFKWQMARNRFSLKWCYGYTSYESVDVMLLVLSRLIRRELEPNLREISCAVQCEFVKRERFMSLSRVHRVNGVVRRNVVRLMCRRSIENIDDIECGKVRAFASEATTDILAHAVIRTFLEQFVLHRLDIIEKDITVRLEHSKKEMESHRCSTRRYDNNKWAEAKVESESCVRKLRLVHELRLRIVPFVSASFLSAAKHDIYVFDVDADEFEATNNYRRLYAAMLEYSRTCFSWTSENSNEQFRILQVDVSNQGETRLQKKYSIVYENWCYARMLSAMKNLSFALQECRYRTDGGGTVCTYEKDGISVKLIHGVLAMNENYPGYYDDCEFYLTDQQSRFRTPDFAIVISVQGIDEDCWIVADAKSDDCLRSHMVETRNYYASSILRYGKKPMASVLFRSGDSEKESPLPGMELPPPTVVEWAKMDERGNLEEKIDHSRDDYRWEPGYGVVPGSNPTVTYHGHVRANIKSVGKDSRVFEEFMDGIIQTGMRRIGALR